MNKRFLLLLPILLALGACEFNVGFIDGSHEPGLDKSYPNSNPGQNVHYTYFSGDNIDGIKNEKTAFTISFDFLKNSDEVLSDIKDIDLLNQYFTADQDNILNTVSEPNYVGVKDGGLFIGTDSSYLIGYITLQCAQPIAAVEIEAKSYYYTTTSFNEEKTIVDTETAVAVNGSSYILLSETADNASVCSYRLNEAVPQITIKVGKRRAFINSITLYY